MIEFAFATPIFLTLLLGGLEIVNMAMTHLRINQVAITVADNASRLRTGVDETNINELFSGAKLVGRSLAFERNGRVVLSSLEPNGQTGSNAGQMINWQRCYGGLNVSPKYGRQGTGRSTNALAGGMGPAGHRVHAADGTAVMYVEVTYRYNPLIVSVFSAAPTYIRYESAFNVRERTNQNITNTKSITINSC
ncbi:TadE/TadG family type IV pilus assembly protein [Novosphingobium indicum]|nr:TadE family protein [Novosphingobium indicum]